jgi:hypothetical protein
VIVHTCIVMHEVQQGMEGIMDQQRYMLRLSCYLGMQQL